jgi:hypothetical protein
MYVTAPLSPYSTINRTKRMIQKKIIVPSIPAAKKY